MRRVRICAPNIWAMSKENVDFAHPIFGPYFMYCAPNLRLLPPPLPGMHLLPMNKFKDEIKTMPIAINQSNANDQHYEVPSEFYVKVLGPYLKYSCGLWTKENTTLEESEVNMLKLYCERANLKEGKI